MSDSQVTSRLEAAHLIARSAGKLALDYFARLSELKILSKGVQDYVTEADREVENAIRKELAQLFPDDSVLGEEHGKSEGSSEFCWVLDPIDGTSNFVRGCSDWVVAIACVRGEHTELAVTYSATADNMFEAVRGDGAKLNGKLMKVSPAQSLSEGVIGFGYSLRRKPELTNSFLSRVFADNGLVYHNASGAAMIVEVAAGRLVAYAEPHMNAWDCVGGLLMVKEAGGVIEEFDMATMLTQGGRVVCACPGVQSTIASLVSDCYDTTN